MTAFEGYPDAAGEFWDGLAADNTKQFWLAHKDIYARAIDAPTTALVETLSIDFGPLRRFRPFRDVRFSSDKRPYNEFTSFAGTGTGGSGSLYVQLGVDGLLVAGGYYRPTTATLTAFREAVDDPVTAATFDTLAQRLQRHGLVLDGNPLTTAPRGWDRNHPRLDLLRLRNLAFTRADPRPDLRSPQLLTHLQELWRELDGGNTWLLDHVGPPAAPPR